jgi:hypothetical protein
MLLLTRLMAREKNIGGNAEDVILRGGNFA